MEAAADKSADGKSEKGMRVQGGGGGACIPMEYAYVSSRICWMFVDFACGAEQVYFRIKSMNVFQWTDQIDDGKDGQGVDDRERGGRGFNKVWHM